MMRTKEGQLLMEGPMLTAFHPLRPPATRRENSHIPDLANESLLAAFARDAGKARENEEAGLVARHYLQEFLPYHHALSAGADRRGLEAACLACERFLDVLHRLESTFRHPHLQSAKAHILLFRKRLLLTSFASTALLDTQT